MSFFLSDDESTTPRVAPIRLVSSSTPSASQKSRLVVCPPELYTRSRPAWQRWLTRLKQRVSASLHLQQATQHDARVVRAGATRVQKVRELFLDLLCDVPEAGSRGLRERVEKARSLRELWHLRPEAYDVLSRFGGQPFAQRRLELLNADFPVRVPQSGRCRPDSGRTVAW